jgi:hypothetical protein
MWLLAGPLWGRAGGIRAVKPRQGLPGPQGGDLAANGGCCVHGFPATDRHGLAQRYLATALRSATLCGDKALGAHVLADLAYQAAS